MPKQTKTRFIIQMLQVDHITQNNLLSKSQKL